MDTIEAPVVESTPVVDAPQTEEATSIADHAAQFSKEAQQETPEERLERVANTGQFANKQPDQRHKAQSQRATPEDVAEINRATKEMRELEQRIGDKDPDAKLSPRVRALRRQIAALKALEAPAPAQKAPEQPKTQERAVAAFQDKEPDFNDYQDPGKYPDPLAAWVRDTARYENRKATFEAQEQQSQQQATAAERAIYEQHNERLASFIDQTPDFHAKAADLMRRELPMLLIRAIVTDDKGPALVYHLAQHPDLADELIFLSQGKAIDNASVAVLQRRLNKEFSQGQAVSTGSVVPPRPYIPPRPPNPVRTGPIKTTDDPPAEAASISDHRKYHHTKR